MNNVFRVILLVSILSVLGCHEPAPRSSLDVNHKRSIEDLTIVKDEFFRLQNEDALPGLLKGTKGTYDVSFFEVTAESQKEPWYVELAKDYGECKRSYLAKVTINNRKLSYLFCMDSGSPKLVVSLEERNGLAYPIPTK
jgi:hypothetical protein